jgi:hypothetical protein
MLMNYPLGGKTNALIAKVVVVWQPAQENSVLSPKTDPLWSLSNNKV